MTLCGLCESIPLDRLPSLPSGYYNTRPAWKYIHPFYGSQQNDRTDKPLGFPHLPNIQALKESATKCELFDLILSSVNRVIAEVSDATGEKLLRHNSPPHLLALDFWIVKRRDGGDGFWVLTHSNNTNKPCVRLVETNGDSGIYATLSHCWGTSIHLTSTRSSLAARKKSIDFNEMPKTFQDVITVARAMSIKYVWIDSLCIMQDDEDWGRESANMTSVYANSYLTIAATSAKDSSFGCFTPRPPKRYVSIDYTPKEGISGQTLAFLPPIQKEALTDFYITMKEEPLTKRAWALQERVLARRTLHFGKHQMYFECCNSLLGENGLRFELRFNSVHTPMESADSKHPVDSTDSALETSLPWPVVTNPNPILNNWHDLLWAYGSRKLTNASDKLPALSGLAQIFSEKLKDQCVASLWRNSLIEGLLWQGLHVNRVPEYRAPSWSWASVDGIPAAGLTEGWELLATIIDCHVEAKGSNPFGEVKNGWTKIQAPLEPLFLDERINSNGEGVPYSKNLKVRTEKGNPKGGYSRFDSDITGGTYEDAVALVQSLKNVKIFALILAKEAATPDQDGLFVYQSLIVSLTDDGGQTMRRLGFIMLDEDTLGGCDSLDPSAHQPIITLI
ncbi:HET-domain-containing protein [Glonium stellatum]|uniref:HET-domain-containing protein n=1 Tax=Glonium stellatum TaxID=574774 RepID=A0A8E2JYK9_9PEZI|nr:HET-domain-containing protein [Glonium stellatum]